MVERTLTVMHEAGLHARPASLLVTLAQKFKCKIGIRKDGKEADAKSILSVMSLGVKKGNAITLWADGEDEEEAINVISSLIVNNFEQVENK